MLYEKSFGSNERIRSRRRPRTLRWWPAFFAVILAVMAGGGFGVAVTSGQTQSACEGFEAEVISTEALRTQATRRRVAEHRRLDFSNLVRVAPAEVDTALAVHVASPFERDTGRHRRHRHQSLLI